MCSAAEDDLQLILISLMQTRFIHDQGIMRDYTGSKVQDVVLRARPRILENLGLRGCCKETFRVQRLHVGGLRVPG